MSYEDPFNTNTTSMDENSANNFYNFNNEDQDPASEFLEREKQELGDITENNTLTNGSHTPMISKSPIPPNDNVSNYEALSQVDEPEKIRKWREEFSARINKKDTEEETKRKEMHEQAKKELDDFYKQRLEQMERNKEQNRVNNRTLENELLSNSNQSTSNGKTYDWEKITNLCEFNPKNNRSQKDLTRYRSVLLQLKQQQINGK